MNVYLRSLNSGSFQRCKYVLLFLYKNYLGEEAGRVVWGSARPLGMPNFWLRVRIPALSLQPTQICRGLCVGGRGLGLAPT
jgi:hypothetical protein